MDLFCRNCDLILSIKMKKFLLLCLVALVLLDIASAVPWRGTGGGGGGGGGGGSGGGGGGGGGGSGEEVAAEEVVVEEAVEGEEEKSSKGKNYVLILISTQCYF